MSHGRADEGPFTCRGCGGTAERPADGGYPVGWYGLTVAVPEWVSTASGNRYVWCGLFCSVTCLVLYGPELQAEADLAHQVYEPVPPQYAPDTRNPARRREPRP